MTVPWWTENLSSDLQILLEYLFCDVHAAILGLMFGMWHWSEWSILTRHSRNICWSDSRMSTTTIYYWKPNDVLLLPLPLPLPLPVDCWGHGHQGYLHRHQSINQSILFMRHLCLSIHLLIPLLYLSTYPALCPLPSALCLPIQPSSSHTNETSIQFPNNCRSTDKAGGWLGTVLLNS